MTAQDKKNPGQVREQTRVRSPVGEPSGSYSYHDESRLESVRGTARTPANDTQAAKPAKKTMVGGFVDPVLAERAAQALSSASAARKPLSEPPEIGSWPPLPNVPNELSQQGDEPTAAAEPELGALPGGPWNDSDDDLAPTDPPKRARTSVSGGAIWEAVAPVLGQPEAESPEHEHEEVEEGPPSDRTQPAVPTAISAREQAPTEKPHVAPERPRAHEPAAHQHHAVSDLVGERMSTTELDYREHEVAKLENLVERGAWEQLAHEIEASAAANSPTVALLQVIAKRELMAANEKGSGKLNQDAIHALASLLGVPPSSPLALLLAKRLLRRNPVWTAKQPATGVSIGIVLGGLAVGIGIGWLVTRIML